MSAAELLADLRALGVALAAEGDRLRYQPVVAVGADLRARLREHKAELLAFLGRPDPDDVARFLAWGTGYCWPAMGSSGVEVAGGEASWRDFAERCAAWELAAVLPLCWWYPEQAVGVLAAGGGGAP